MQAFLMVQYKEYETDFNLGIIHFCILSRIEDF